MADIRVIRHHVGRVRRDLDRFVEEHLLPSRRRFSAEGRAREQRAGGRPQVADVRPAVADALVEAHALDEAVDVAAELQAELERTRVVDVGHRGDRRRAPDAGARAAARDHRHGEAGAGSFLVAAVVDRARADRGGAESARRPFEGPRRRALRRPPGGAAVDRDFDAGHRAAAVVGRRARDHHAIAAADAGASRRRTEWSSWAEGVGRSGAADQVRLQRRGLRAHVGEEVDGCLLHREVGRVRRQALAMVVVSAVEAPRPLHGAGAEDERTALVAVERQVVRGGADGDGGSEVDDLLDAVDPGRRQVDHAGRAARRCRDLRPTHSRATRAPACRRPAWRCACCARGAGSPSTAALQSRRCPN